MNAVWQVQEAKNRFSEVIDRALSDGPQVVTRHGKVVVRVVAAGADSEDSKLAQVSSDGFLQYLLAAPRGIGQGNAQADGCNWNIGYNHQQSSSLTLCEHDAGRG